MDRPRAPMTLNVLPQRLLPVRGVVPVHTAKHLPLTLADVHRLERLERVVFKVQKLDFLVHGSLPARFDDMVEYARGLDLQPSLRTDCSLAPEREALAKHRFFDVCLTPVRPEAGQFPGWLDFVRDTTIPFRVQLLIPGLADAPDNLAERLIERGAGAVTLVVRDPFLPSIRCRNAEESRQALRNALRLAELLKVARVEVNLYGIPRSAVGEGLQRHVGNARSFFNDHQQYARQAWRLAADLYHRHPYIAGKILLALTARYTSARNPLDDWFLEWLFLKHKVLLSWVLLFRKVTRDMRLPWGRPKPLDRTSWLDEADLDALLAGPPTDADRRAYRETLPGLATPEDDWSLHPECSKQPKYYDAVDSLRARFTEHQRTLAERAKTIMANRPPDAVVRPSLDYGAAESRFHEPLSSAVRWMAGTNVEKLSNSVAWLHAPFTVSVTFGGGFAEYIGFRVTTYGRILCPMEQYTHRLTLHVAEDGSYVLLRDGELMRPVEFEGRYYAPLRLSFPVDLYLSLWNVDGDICSQTIDLWRGEETGVPDRTGVKYSVVIFSTRFSRRLQAVLQSIAHQRDADPRLIEVLIGYVPGIDTTDDVVDSIRLSHPEWRIVRVPFPEHNVKSKGFVINECCRMAAGEWIIVLDSDILLPPRMFTELETSLDGGVFFAPAGRHMLDRATTARVLLGEVRPWEEWDRLIRECSESVEGEAEGIPIGYCQIFRKSCLEKVRYAEYEHFERADSDFGLDMRREFGREKRLAGLRVLHLDHGGSQWFGVYKHQ